MAVKKTTSKTKRKSNGKSAGARNTATAKKNPMKMPTIKEPLSKTNLIKTIQGVTCIDKKNVVAVWDCLNELISRHVKSGGPGVFVMPVMMKISVVKKPARAARKGINPFTGEEIMIKAKPAYKTVKIRALKKLKEMVA